MEGVPASGSIQTPDPSRCKKLLQAPPAINQSPPAAITFEIINYRKSFFLEMLLVCIYFFLFLFFCMYLFLLM